MYGSTGNDTIIYTDSGANAWQELHYSSLDDGVRVTIDSSANRATVDKGSAGTDTIVDINNALTGWGFGLWGTSSDDVFDLGLRLRPGNEEWMHVTGGAGNDTINVSDSYTVRIDYRGADHGIDVDLRAGRANDDGHGDVDTINGPVYSIRGTDFSDRIGGSDRDESFIGRWGNDFIDGGGGFDRLRFDRRGVEDVEVDLSRGTATGTWDGNAFAYSISNIEWVRGGGGNDILRGSAGDEQFQGRSGNDSLYGGDGNDTIEGGAGNDLLSGGTGDDLYVFAPGHGNDTISNVDDGDRADLSAFGTGAPAFAQLVAASVEVGGDVLVDLTAFGGGTILVRGTSLADADPEGFIGLSVDFAPPLKTTLTDVEADNLIV